MTLTTDPNRMAARRYIRRLLPAMLGFLACSLGFGALRDTAVLGGPLGYALALVPVALLLFAFWAFLRFLGAVDEFIRSVHSKGAWFGLVAVLAVATAWGFFEQHLAAPDLPLFWLNPLFWLCYALATAILSRRVGLAI